MKILFAGTAAIALPALQRLAEHFPICAVLTTPDRLQGRGHHKKSSPVKRAAQQLGLPLLQPERLNESLRSAVQADAPDLLVCVAYGKIFGPKFLALFPRGGINLHPSLLPRYRGPSPVAAAILAGDCETGVTVQWLATEMDAGDILMQQRIALDGRETKASLECRCGEIGAQLLEQTVVDIAQGDVSAYPQDSRQISYCSLISKADGRIDWDWPATRIERMIRAYTPWPTAYTYWEQHRLTLYQGTTLPDGPAAPVGQVVAVDAERGILIQTGHGMLVVVTLQLANGRVMSWRDFINGHKTFVGSRLT